MNKSKIIKTSIFIFTLIISLNTYSQDSTFVASLTHQRGFIDTRILHLGVKSSSKNTLALFEQANAQKSIKLYKKSKYFLPVGPPLVLGGIYLGYDAIKGTKMQAEVDGKLYTYYVRPIEQLLGGIAVFAVGICMIEYANEFKAKSVDLYNENQKNKQKSDKLDLKVGFTPSGKVGLYANF
jgi:hypothetical protein